MTRNVVASWAGHLVFVIAGFILPRLIDRQIGQETLGVWDFGWSMVSYFGLVSGGVMGAVSRYVAGYRAAGDDKKVSMTVSTGLMIYFCGGAIVLMLTILATAFVPTLFSTRLAGHIREAQWVVLILGVSLVVKFVFGVFNGVVTGCHRWGVHNAITSGVYVVTASGMILALLGGGGLPAMAGVSLAGEVISGLLRAVVAYRVCPQLRISIDSVSLRHAAELIGFGGKSLLESVSRVILYQTNHLLILGFLGPAALALYARPAALVRHASHLLNKFAYVFTPTASALLATKDRIGDDSKGRLKSLQDLLIKGTRYSLYVCLPMVLVLALAGSPILRLWMGERYDQGLVLAILAVGHLASLSQRATYHVLVGMGRHGLPAVATFVASLCSVVLTVLALSVLKWGLVGAALAVVVPLTVVYSAVVPMRACRVLGMSFSHYLIQVIPGPALAATPLLICLLFGRAMWPQNPAASLGWSLGLGGVVTCAVYWRYVVPPSLRDTLFRVIAWPTGRSSASQA